MKTRSEARAAAAVRTDQADAKALERKKYNGLYCSECGYLQFTSPSGDTCANGHGGVRGVSEADWQKLKAQKDSETPSSTKLKVAELSGQLKEELRTPKPSPFKFENANAATLKPLRADLNKIVQSVFVEDVNQLWQKLRERLSLGEYRSDHGHVLKAMDEAERDAYDAHRLYITAKIEREKWERENEVVFGAMWSEATRSLQREKEDGQRAKQITDADIRARVATLYPEEYQAQEVHRAQVKATVDNLEHLVELCTSRCRTLQAAIGKLRG